MKNFTLLILFITFFSHHSFAQFGCIPPGAGPDKSICVAGNSTTLGQGLPFSGWTYSWTPTTNLSNPNIYNPVASPTITRTYTFSYPHQYESNNKWRFRRNGRFSN
jgi:hypothetical protein